MIIDYTCLLHQTLRTVRYHFADIWHTAVTPFVDKINEESKIILLLKCFSLITPAKKKGDCF